MSERNTIVRSMHDLGLAAWFGGTLMGAVGLNGAANEAKDSTERAHLASVGWAKWAPVNAAAIGVHVVGAAALLNANIGRVRNQKGVRTSSIVKTALTVAAMGSTAYSGKLGRDIGAAGHVEAAGGTVPHERTPDKVAKAMQQERIVQWVNPALTGALIIVSALQGEQQRPLSIARGLVSAARASLTD